MSGAMDLENCSSELKEAYRSVYTLAKNLDEQKKKLTTIGQLFNPDVEQKRIALIQRCQTLLLKDNHVIGKKIREILWRKGYYEFIAFIKRNWHKEDKRKNTEWLEKLQDFILKGISNYKRIIVELEKIYDLDLQLLVDFSIINEEYGLQNGCDNSSSLSTSSSTGSIQKSLEAVGFALDTIHSAFLSIGDLHRYYLDFKLDSNNTIKSSMKIIINKELTARYYHQAFQLNPTIGMAQNQLGTLFYGQNYDLDSIYHYLYSLICTVPFDLSETNVCKLFVAHAEYLEDLSPDKIEFSLRDFYARFFLIVDIFFFDKNVPDFNSLCHCVLIDLRKILCSKTININEPSIMKIVCILLFCMSKLKMINSQKVYSLNAFLVAVCSDLIDSCIVNLEQFILSKSKQNEKFQEVYTNAFNIFEANVRRSREEYKAYYNKRQRKDVFILNSNTKMITKSSGIESDSCKSQKTSQDHDEKQTPPDITSHVKDIKKTNDNYPKIGRNSGDSQPKSSNSLSNKSSHGKRNGKHNMKLRRRRRRIARSDDDDDDDESCSFITSDSELDTDFSSNDEDEDYYDNDYDDVSDLSSNFESDFSDIEESNKPGKVNDGDIEESHKNSENLKNENQINESQDLHHEIINTFSDNEDMVIEEERIIYPNDPDSANLIESFNNLNMINDMLHFKSENEDENLIGTAISRPQSSADDGCLQLTNGCNSNDDNKDSKEPPVKLKYKNKYTKIDPNIIIEFTKNENTIRALKILFDWLRINNEILMGCYHTNPEFIHKIMKLLNYCNIDIFTRKVYFERDLIKTDNVRDKLEDLFMMRSSIPLSEDMILKGLDLLKTTQSMLDWETPIRDRITENEENIMRIFKMVDFAFFVCKLKKFSYSFCSKSRRFMENMKNKRDKKRSAGRKRERDHNLRKCRNSNNGDRRRNGRNNHNGRNSRNGGRRRRNDGNYEDRRGSTPKMIGNTNEVRNLEQDKNQITVIPRKGYLRNRNQTIIEKVQEQQQQEQSSVNSNCSDDISDVKKQKNEQQKNVIEEKCRLMGRLWLKNEVETLEAELKQKPIHIVLTPFIVVDAKALTEYTGIVKALVQSKRFIVLIPNAVLGELDQLKKQSDCARNAIRWLEQEFKVGNRHMRAQRDHETKPLLLIKIPKKLDRESSVFVQIAKFCNFIVSNHSDDTEYEANLVTFLSGDHLNDKKTTNLSFTGILDAIPVRHDQISNFYEKFKKK